MLLRTLWPLLWLLGPSAAAKAMAPAIAPALEPALEPTMGPLREPARASTCSAPVEALPASGQSSRKKQATAAPSGPTDEDITRAWKKLPAEEKSEVIEFFSAECERLQTFQAGLIRYLISKQDRPADAWPEQPAELPLFDASVHAPAEPTMRHFKSASSVKSFQKKVFRKQPERKLDSRWVYDYASGELQRLEGASDLEVIFRNGLAGFEPRHAMSEALLERMLDDGSLRTTHQAFGHAYADRSGSAYPGVTLYDIWASGLEMEMPDVECLGIVHMLDNDWKKWRAPVRKQDSLYERIGEHFARARRHRGLRNALARVFLCATPALNDGYEGNLERFHALWDQQESDPEKLVQILPEPDDWQDWLEKTGRTIDKSRKLNEGGMRRRATLAQDAGAVRATLIYVMRELEALPGE